MCAVEEGDSKRGAVEGRKREVKMERGDVVGFIGRKHKRDPEGCKACAGFPAAPGWWW